ncbi:TIGR04283 family arsenosugar biosynthesis glycosyltransferase [Halovulum sp. GXIMD14794]
MPAPISIVIPTLNAADTIGPTLAALAEGLGEGLIRELVLSDGGSADGIEDVAEAAGAELVTGASGRGGQIRRGIEASSGAWLMVLHADSRPLPGWPAAVARHIADRPDRAGYFDLRFDAEGLAPLMVAGWANRRSRLFGLPYGDQGLLIRRAVLEHAGGFPDLPLMEDVALARALGRKALAPLGHPILTSADKYRRQGWLRRGARNLGTLARYYAGAAPEELATRYRR